MGIRLIKGSPLRKRHEEAVRQQIEKLREERSKRFRVLVSLKDEETLYVVRMAARLANCDACDIVLLYVRPIDRSGAIQIKLARQNMLEAGYELPGLRLLKKGLEVLKEELGLPLDRCETQSEHMSAWGDAAGDNKVVFNCPSGREIVLKLKVAPDPATGILDQYELGPYNLIIMGEPTRWKKSGIWLLFHQVVAERVLAFAPCSVLIARDSLDKKGFFICTDGTERSMEAVRRSAVLAYEAGEEITLFSAAPTLKQRKKAREAVNAAAAELEKLKIPVKETIVAIGDPAEKIVERGSKYMVIVVSDKGRSRLRRILFGSTATTVTRKAKTSVLDVR